jgi:hypothetical protein
MSKDILLKKRIHYSNGNLMTCLYTSHYNVELFFFLSLGTRSKRRKILPSANANIMSMILIVHVGRGA